MMAPSATISVPRIVLDMRTFLLLVALARRGRPGWRSRLGAGLWQLRRKTTRRTAASAPADCSCMKSSASLLSRPFWGSIHVGKEGRSHVTFPGDRLRRDAAVRHGGLHTRFVLSVPHRLV